ncbi:hypothetical protein NP233_g2826 [Leucocoprinus birnbaumii]|uniref:CUE domain-containing protein n=1 Tax=Leucocoprinus birnbaumii TaxID=56174 RepID=A0AAD5VY71_9AGAR|nr:hypothetical protein NP233_g2826 [Leucocoprinus birnbaumii]
MTIARLSPYPPLQSRLQLPASQLASLNKIIASALLQIIGLPSAKRDTDSSRVFVQSYARDASFQVLQTLIWGSQDNGRPSTDEDLIRRYTVQLAEKIAPSLDLQTLLDLTIGYSTTKGYKQKLKTVLKNAAESEGSIHGAIEKELVPALTILLSPQSSNQAQGLYAPPQNRPFKPFILALAHAYDTSLLSIATSYGGINVLQNAMNRPPEAEIDDWERIWVDTKVALIDAFHILFSQMVEDMSSAKGRSLGIEAERTFDIIFALLEQSTLSSSSSTANDTPLTPFLNRSLLADYQQSYSLTKTLVSALKHAEEKDARLDMLESALACFDSDGPGRKEPGALKIVLRSYGIQHGIDNRGDRSRHQQNQATSSTQPPAPHVTASSNKGKGKAHEPVEDPELDIKVTQVLDVLPDLSSDYVRLLLGSSTYHGDLERVLGALLEGNAPSEEELLKELDQSEQPTQASTGAGGYDVSQRRNVFDDQEMNLSQITSGKKNLEPSFLQDKTFVNQMKADILRRAEAIFAEEEEEEETLGGGTGQSNERVVFSPEDEWEEAEALKIKVMGDGEETDESGSDEEEDEKEEEKLTPETILELAWIRDAKLFDRDAVTRRSKGREQLRKETGWADEQIEGWKVMLDRNPKMQEKIKQKHEFSGNQPSIPIPGPSRGGQGGAGGRGRGRGRGRGGRGGGPSRGGSTQGSSSDPNTARERSFQNKHKASRGNHNRKRGHDKKMARSGAGIPPGS